MVAAPRTGARHARLVAPRVVAEERRRRRRQLDTATGHIDPAHAAADELVGGPLAEQPAVDACDLDGILVRTHGAVAQHVTSDAELVVLEHEAQRAHRFDDLDPQRPHAVVVDVRPPPPRQPDVVLPALVADADEPVEHIVVLVEPNVRGQADVAVGIAQAHVVAVVPLRIAAGDAGEGLGDLVQRVFVESGEQRSFLSGVRGRRPSSGS